MTPPPSSTAADRSAREWNRLLDPYKTPAWAPALAQLATSLLPYLFFWGAMAWSVQTGRWGVFALATVLAAGFFLRVFIIQHDCGHGAFFPDTTANNRLGAVLGVLTFFPYGYWKRTHAIHHATHGNLDRREFGDVDTLTVAEYQSRGLWGRLGYRLYRNPLVLFGIGPVWQFVVKHRVPFDIPFSWKREWASVLWTNLAIVAVFGGLVWWLGWQTVVAVQLTVVALAGGVGVWLFYVQHQFEEAYWDEGDEWSFHRAGAEGSSFYDLPLWLHWFTGNIGYHHIHHLSSRIPNYRLRACFEENEELRQVTHLSLMDSLACARLRLWCEDRRRMVSFRDADLPAPGEERRAAA